MEAQAAFLGPNLWDKTLPYDTDLKVHQVSFPLPPFGRQRHALLTFCFFSMPIWMNFYQKMVSQWMDCQATIWVIRQAAQSGVTNQIRWAVISERDSPLASAR